MPMGFMPGSDDVNQFKKLDQTGQTDADIFGGIPPGGFGGEHGFGFGDRFGFGNGGHVGLSNFDPLNAMNFHTSTRRRRRFADGQKVTKVSNSSLNSTYAETPRHHIISEIDPAKSS